MPRTVLIFVTLASLAALAQTPQPITPVACLRKAALDLTNQAPSSADISAVQSGQWKSYIAVVDGYLQTQDFYRVAYRSFQGFFAPNDQTQGDAAEPARIALDLLVTDSDFRGLVTANYTVNPQGQRVPTAGAAGVLSTQAYISSYDGLLGRSWAGHLLQTLVDVHLTPVSNVPPGTDVSRAGLAASPACAGCHEQPVYGIDKLAPFRDCFDLTGVSIPNCKPTPTTFLGKPGATLQDLGGILAGSVEWRSSMIRFWVTTLLSRPIGQNETDFFFRLDSAFMGSGYKLRSLIQAIVESPEYCQR